MDSVNEFPNVMAQAQEDLCGNGRGRFSPEDWANILAEAKGRFETKMAQGHSPQEAWASVVREFHVQHYWGYSRDARAPAVPKPRRKNLGMFFVWMTFSTFVITLMAVVWLGQIYTASDEPKDAYRFFAAIALVLCNFAYFLWHSRHYQD